MILTRTAAGLGLLLLALSGCQTRAAAPYTAGALLVPGSEDVTRTGLHRHAADCQAAPAKAAAKGLAPAELDAADPDGMTALALAARAGCLPVVSALVAAGAEADRVDPGSGWTPLHHAASQRHAAVVDYLLAHGALQERKTRMGQSPLGLALVTAPRHYGPAGDRRTTELVLLSGARTKVAPAAVASATPARKPAGKKKPAPKTAASSRD